MVKRIFASHPTSHFIGGPESVKILGVRGILCMWPLVFALCHRLIRKKNKKKMSKGCLMVMADSSDLGHGKKKVASETSGAYG